MRAAIQVATAMIKGTCWLSGGPPRGPSAPYLAALGVAAHNGPAEFGDLTIHPCITLHPTQFQLVHER